MRIFPYCRNDERGSSNILKQYLISAYLFNVYLGTTVNGDQRIKLYFLTNLKDSKTEFGPTASRGARGSFAN